MKVLFATLIMMGFINNAKADQCSGSWVCVLSCNGPEAGPSAHWWCAMPDGGQSSPAHLGASYSTGVITISRGDTSAILSACIANGLPSSDAGSASISGSCQ